MVPAPRPQHILDSASVITEANQEVMAGMTSDEMTRHELFAEWILVMLDGCSDDDEIRPALMCNAIREAGVEPSFAATAAGLLRRSANGVREDLAEAAERSRP